MHRKATLWIAAILVLAMAPGAFAEELKEFKEKRVMDPYDMARAGLQYARKMIRKDHRECANILLHLAYQESEAAEMDRDIQRLRVVDSQLDIIRAALNIERADSALLFIDRTRKTIRKITNQAARDQKLAELEVLKKRAKAMQS